MAYIKNHHAYPTVSHSVAKGSVALLVRLYKDAGAHAIECSPTIF